MQNASEDVESRQPVWEALSELFLDTDTSIGRDRRVLILSASPYSLAELDSILVNEVFPVCRGNPLSVAGEWAAFDPMWLRNRILRRAGRPFRWKIGRRSCLKSTEWQATRAGVESIRMRRTND
jgi:hypothetical protein